MAKDVTGYNIYLKVDYDGTAKILGGVTEESFNLTARTKTRIRKEDAGVETTVKTGYDGDFSISGVSDINEAELTRLDKTDMIDMLMDTVNQNLDFVYGINTPIAGDVTYTGKLVVLSYSETTNAEGEANFTLNCKLNSALTKVTAA